MVSQRKSPGVFAICPAVVTAAGTLAPDSGIKFDTPPPSAAVVSTPPPAELTTPVAVGITAAVLIVFFGVILFVIFARRARKKSIVAAKAERSVKKEVKREDKTRVIAAGHLGTQQMMIPVPYVTQAPFQIIDRSKKNPPYLHKRHKEPACGCEHEWEMIEGRHICRYFGTFHCDRCRKNWSSAYVWSDNGRDEAQECRGCGVASYPIHKQPRESKHCGGRIMGAHDRSRCGMCQRLGYACDGSDGIRGSTYR